MSIPESLIWQLFSIPRAPLSFAFCMAFGHWSFFFFTTWILGLPWWNSADSRGPHFLSKNCHFLPFNALLQSLRILQI